MPNSVPAQPDAVVSLQNAARLAWDEPDPMRKCVLVGQLQIDGVTGSLPVTANPVQRLRVNQVAPIDTVSVEPGVPIRPSLVQPNALSRRATAHAKGRAAMLHAIAHIEFNAINLALDAAWRYPDMPAQFTTDWISVAQDEARHFKLLVDELAISDVHYGDFDAHDGLWEMARKTAADLQARMALVPRVLEARGLDATPRIQQKMRAANDQRAIDLLQIILDDEVGHVRIGDRWFRALCQLKGDEPEACYRDLIDHFNAPRPRGPLNESARLQAGFSERELRWLRGDDRQA